MDNHDEHVEDEPWEEPEAVGESKPKKKSVA
jgi:hypothetical protein